MGRGKSGAGGGGGGGGIGERFSAKVDDEEFRQMTAEEQAEYYLRQMLTEEQRKAFELYTNPNEEDGSLYNFSQNMNYAIANGLKLTPEQQEVFDQIMGSMHNLGYNGELTRYDHADAVNDILRQVGVYESASSMSVGELRDALQGVSYTDSRILSTSVNNFADSSDPATFTTRQFKITYQAKAGTKCTMPGASKVPHRRSGLSHGDDFGEMLLSPDNKYRIADVKYSGSRARRKGSRKTSLTLQQIEIVVEVGD